MTQVPTPYASHAFHPIDGFLQSVPYHMYVFMFPMHKFTYLSLYMFVNVWTVSIHDAEYRVPDVLKPFINGAAHHTDHHLFYNYNYGQYFTLWDRLAGSFRTPAAWEGKGPLDTINKLPHPGYGENEAEISESKPYANGKSESASASHKRRVVNGHANGHAG
jgi:lathosterol oxidase